MKTNSLVRFDRAFLIIAITCSASPIAFAQSTSPSPGGSGTRGGVLITGQHPFDNVTAGIADRGPGHMVSQGVAAQQAAADFARSEITITETHQTSVQAQALVKVIQALFDGLDQALITLGNAFLTRQGLPAGTNLLLGTGTGTTLTGQ